MGLNNIQSKYEHVISYDVDVFPIEPIELTAAIIMDGTSSSFSSSDMFGDIWNHSQVR